VHPSRSPDVLRSWATAPTTCPGVAGVGPKTAVKLIAEHGPLSGLYEHLDRVESKGGPREGWSATAIRRSCLTISSPSTVNVPVQWELNELSVRPVECKEDRAHVPRAGVHPAPWRNSARQSGAGRAERWKRPAANIARVTRAGSGNGGGSDPPCGHGGLWTRKPRAEPAHRRPGGICLSWQSGSGVYIPAGAFGDDSPQNSPATPRWSTWPPCSPMQAVRWVAAPRQVRPRSSSSARDSAAFPWHSTTKNWAAAYLLDPAGRHSARRSGAGGVQHRMIPIDSLIGSGRKQISFAEVPLHKATNTPARTPISRCACTRPWRRRFGSGPGEAAPEVGSPSCPCS